jgi:hypothetical protein
VRRLRQEDIGIRSDEDAFISGNDLRVENIEGIRVVRWRGVDIMAGVKYIERFCHADVVQFCVDFGFFYGNGLCGCIGGKEKGGKGHISR